MNAIRSRSTNFQRCAVLKVDDFNAIALLQYCCRARFYGHFFFARSLTSRLLPTAFEEIRQ